jgi:membrane protein implicated in regulation of membrane protease activity
MRRRTAIALYVLVLVVIVVGADVLFLSHHFWLRLVVNIGIVVVFAVAFAAFYQRRLRQP